MATTIIPREALCDLVSAPVQPLTFREAYKKMVREPAFFNQVFDLHEDFKSQGLSQKDYGSRLKELGLNPEYLTQEFINRAYNYQIKNIIF